MRPLDRVTGCPAYALVRLGDADSVTLLGGTRADLHRFADVPLESGSPAAGRRFDRLLLAPFRQVWERGFEAHDDATPLSCLTIEQEYDVALGQLLRELPDQPAQVADPGGFDIDDPAYAELVRQVVEADIGNGEGANLVLARSFQARLAGWGTAAALSVFRRLLEREHGAYWTFLVFTGDRYLVGASPERHVSVHGGAVRMNPISGTLRLAGSADAREQKQALLNFLADDKEIFELFMVVDEELKVMCQVCGAGGQVLGPYLKEMSQLLHTEYLLAGRSGMDVREVLRRSMYAATVTGSPVQNACRLIKHHERRGRGYYGGVLALLGRDQSGAPTADAPIVIRTADVDTQGHLRVSAGATLVRDSDPDREVLETSAKAAGVLSAFGLAPPAPQVAPGAPPRVDEDVLIALGSRNQRLSRFWLTDQSGVAPVPSLAGRSALVVDGEDEFVSMLSHLLQVLGLKVSVLPHDRYERGAYDGYDLAIVGPGPGDPRDRGHPKLAAMRRAVADRLAAGKPLLAVCLGHQLLCAELGMELHYKDIAFQGTQTTVDILGRRETVGFYNTFVARAGDRCLPAGVRVDADPATGDVHLVSGPCFRGVQFHPESILTEHGYELLRELAVGLLTD
jgi:2-amino-4-deoxychorismate synthase